MKFMILKISIPFLHLQKPHTNQPGTQITILHQVSLYLFSLMLKKQNTSVTDNRPISELSTYRPPRLLGEKSERKGSLFFFAITSMCNTNCV